MKTKSIQSQKAQAKKTLGQIAYEASPRGGQQTWGPWDKIKYPLIRELHEEMAAAVAKEVMRRFRARKSATHA